MSETLLGVSQLNTSLILLRSTDIPRSEITWPERDLFQPKLALTKPGIQLVLFEFLWNQMKMFRVFVFILGVDQNVI
jgi:hypothetical protein